ncbi:restriction endonuclease [Deinococcus aquaedulcis]|uniref:restriction endonuclease n=1 Tax=Deinococcus aquaedulcis TaxID=2840455 RepID=UPI001C833FC5|nr:restriction endonuclease [Deinococcus aquaedulcis]
MTRKSPVRKLRSAARPKITPGQAALLEALTQVMQGTQGPQVFSDVLRRLDAQNVQTGASNIFDAVMIDRDVRALAGQQPRFEVTANKQLRWLGEGTASAIMSKPPREAPGKTTQKIRRSSKVTVRPEPAAALPKKRAPSRKALLREFLKLTPTEFERLCARVMTAIGVQDVQETHPTNDAGVDVRGLLVIEDLIRIRVAVQVKRYKGNVSRPEVQKLRGSLSHGEVGWFMTTGDYSPGAQEEAKASDRQPISLLNGLEIADLVLKYSVPLTGDGEDQ